MIACSIVLMFDPAGGLMIVAMVLGLWLFVYGLRKLVYYLTMAHHMAGGLSVLFFALIAIDLGALSLVLFDEPRIPVMLYLVGFNAFTGFVCIFRALEAKNLGSSWKPSLLHGIVSLALVVICLVFINSDRIIMAALCFGLIYAAVVRIVSALRPTQIIYIQ